MDAALCAFPGLENAAKCLAVLHRRHQGVILLKALGLGLFKQKAIRLFSQRASPEWNCSPSASHPLFAPHPPPISNTNVGVSVCSSARFRAALFLSETTSAPSLSAFAFSRGPHLTLALAFCSLSCASASPKSQAFHLILLDRTDSFRCSIYCVTAFVIAFRAKWRGREAVGWNRTHGTHIWRGKRRSNCLVAISTNDPHADTWDTRWEKMNPLKARNVQFPLQL